MYLSWLFISQIKVICGCSSFGCTSVQLERELNTVFGWGSWVPYVVGYGRLWVMIIHDKECTYNVTLRRVLATIVVVEKRRVFLILSVFLKP